MINKEILSLFDHDIRNIIGTFCVEQQIKGKTIVAIDIDITRFDKSGKFIYSLICLNEGADENTNEIVIRLDPLLFMEQPVVLEMEQLKRDEGRPPKEDILVEEGLSGIAGLGYLFG